jgi:hypothetical protein
MADDNERRPGSEEAPPPRDAEKEPTGGAKGDEAATAFINVLRKNGQLIDVDTTTDLSSLPPHITHVLYPDGRLERVGFD